MSPAPADLLIMGRHLGNGWGGVYEVLRGVLQALDGLEAARGRRIELLLPREGMQLPRLENVRPVVLGRWGRSRLLWDHRTVPAYANRRENAVLYNPGIVLPAGLRVPAIVSIHDMAYFPRPELGGESEYLAGDAWYMRRMIRRSLQRAGAVHVPSQFTRGEILRLFPEVDAGRIRVWPYGVDAERWGRREDNEPARAQLRARGVEPPYLLYAGGLSKRKNVAALVTAFMAYRERHPGLKLVLTGGAKRTMAEEGLESAMRRGEEQGAILRLGRVEPDLLRTLYQQASALVYPSLYEGFGLPPLEAQASGCPVVCARSTSIPEVVGEGALFYEAGSPRALEEALGQLEVEGERERLIRKGLANAGRRGWDVISLKLMELADKMIAPSMSDRR